MTKRIVRALAIGSLIGGLAACNNNETIDQQLTGGEEFAISAGLTTVVPQEATRAVTGTTTPFTNQTFGLIVKDNREGKNNVSLKAATAKTNEQLTGNTQYDEVGNVAKIDPALAILTPKIYWDDMGGKLANLNLIGIHPHAASPSIDSDMIVWNVKTNQSAGVDASDIMLAYRPRYTYADKHIAANLNFNHVMAKVTINLIKGENYGDTGFESPTVTITNLPASGTVDIVPNADKSYTITNKVIGEITPTTPTIIEGSTSYTTTAIVVPTVVPAGTVVAKVTIDGNMYNVKVAEETSIIAGGNNVLNVTINKSEISVSATITDWSENELPAISNSLVAVEVSPIQDTKITEGSSLLVSIKDANNKTHLVKYIATEHEDSKLYWDMSGTPLHWDDIAYPTDGSKLTANALLRVGSETSEDICIGSFTEIAAAQSKLVLTMERQMSKITIKLKTTTGEDKVNFSESDVVTLPNYFGYTVSDVIITKNTVAENLEVPYLEKADSDATWVYETIIIPQTIDKSKYIISVKIGQNTYNVPVSVQNTDEVFAASEHYIYTIIIKKSGIELSTTISDWNTITKPDIDTDLDK